MTKLYSSIGRVARDLAKAINLAYDDRKQPVASTREIRPELHEISVDLPVEDAIDMAEAACKEMGLYKQPPEPLKNLWR